MSQIRREISALTRLSAPVIATQLGAMLIGVVDTLMVARISVDALAAAALGHVWAIGTLFCAQGIILGIDPIVSQAHGAGEGDRMALALQRALVLALLVSIPVCALFLYTAEFLTLAGQDPELAQAAEEYVRVQLPSVPCFLLFTAMRQYLQGRTLVTPAMWVMLAANLFNIAANWALIFGHLGAPALGLVGAGIATTLTRAFLFVGLLAWILDRRLQRGAWRPWSWEALRFSGLRQILALGIPVWIQLSLEIWAFSLSTLLAGRVGLAELASHQIVLNLASLSFMMPLGIAIGASTRVGNLIGAGNYDGVRRTSRIALLMGAGIMSLSAAGFVLFRRALPAMYTSDLMVIELCAWILPAAAAFQIFDGTQVVGCGILRGMGRTRAAAAATGVAYYVLALPAAWWFCFRLDAGLAGIWWGLCLGLALVAAFLVPWVFRAAAAQRPIG